MSTTDEQDMKYLSKLVFDKKSEVLEAPITGGQHRAESGNIAILVGGSRESFKRSFPILSCIGHKILHCGEIGKASTLKVVTNYLASINLLALGEALMVCKKYGIDLKTAFEGIKISSGNSFVHETESQVILNGSYDVGFTMDLVCKDLGLFDKLTKKYEIPAELSSVMLEIFQRGRDKLGNRSLSTSIVKLIEEKCNENLRASGFPSFLEDKNQKQEAEEIII
jgi:3-hydroxyisobutyrate dehydrogenase